MFTGTQFSQPYFLLFDLVFGKRAAPEPEEEETRPSLPQLAERTVLEVRKLPAPLPV